MSIIRQQSKVFLVVSGEYRDMRCVVRSVGPGDKVGVIDIEGPDGNKIVFVNRGELAQIYTPGFPYDSLRENYHMPCSVVEYAERSNLEYAIRDEQLLVAQSRMLRGGDSLATRDFVTKSPRRGFNDTVLVCLEQIGWIELASRLPIALLGNTNFKLPIELIENDCLATGCLVVKKSQSTVINFTNIYLDRLDCCIDVPSCVPLALAQ